MTVQTYEIRDFPGGEKSFVEIPFDVGDDIERVEVSYTFPAGSGGSVIDIGLARNGQSRGWTGSEYGHIWVAEDRASPGYRTGALPGQWHVVLGIVKVGPDPWVDLSIRLVRKTPVWLAGELHSHTEHSDGGVMVGEAIARARNSGCEFLSITDHNATSQNHIRPDDPGILVIAGMELTSYWGHTNFHGLKDPLDDWRCYTPEDVPRKMAEAREKGATIVVNHPFQNSAGGRWQCGFDVPFDAYEIWNGNWAVHNEQALAHWQDMLAQGRKVPCTGGSDFHLKNRRRHGRPANRLFSQSRSIRDILAAVRGGQNVVCIAPDEAMVVPAGGSAMFGTVSGDDRIGLRFSGLAQGDIIKVVTEKGVVDQISAVVGEQEIDVPLGERFTRCEVWHGEVPRLFSNPVYRG